MGGGRQMSLVRAAAVGVLATVAASFGIGPATADSRLTSPVPVYDWYVGAGVFADHHTGFVPNTNNMYNIEKYEPGGKAFVGYRINDTFSTELSFDYFGSTSFYEGFPTMSTERSFAVTGTVLAFTPPMSEWMPWYNDVMPSTMPVRLFARGGLAYKNIHQEAYDGTFDEGILSFVVGGGAEFEITPRWFARVEYEFVSTALSGPSEPFTALNGLFTAHLGGTARVVNVMNTEIAVSGGFRF
jgi:hypothetical protein